MLKQITTGFLVALLLSSCVSKKEFLSLNNERDRLENDSQTKDKVIEEKNKLLDASDKKIDSLAAEIKLLRTKLDSLNIEYEALDLKYEEATRTAQYYYQMGIDSAGQGNYPGAMAIFKIIIEKFPNDEYSTLAKGKIAEISKISNSKFSKLNTGVRNKNLKEKVIALRDSKAEGYYTPDDLEKIDGLLRDYNTEIEAEKYISVKEDKMQECFFYETSRSTSQYTSGVRLMFELYIVKNYSGRKYFRLRTRYSDDDWMFYDEVIIRGSNGVQVSIETEYPEKKTDSSGYGVTEWSDNYVNSSDQYKLIKISRADEVTVRYDGKYRYDMTLDEGQMKAFREIVKKFESL